MTSAILAAALLLAPSGHVMNAGEMGFPQNKTQHHFHIYADGGAIVVQALDGRDVQTIAQVRFHLRHIAAMFARGDFQAPILVHGQTPPGTLTLHRLGAEVSYAFAELPRGGEVRITSANPQGVEATHAFLRFQISAHHTGDPLTTVRRR